VADDELKKKIIKEAIKSIEEFRKSQNRWREKVDFVKFLFTPLAVEDRRLEKYFRKNGVKSVRDLLLFLPGKYVDRRRITTVFDAMVNSEAVIKGKVVSRGEVRTPGGKKFYQVILKDKTGALKLVWFNYNRVYPSKMFKEGEEVLVAGKVVFDTFSGYKSIIHPELIKEDSYSPGIIPIYPQERFLSQEKVREKIKTYLQQIKIDDYLPDRILSKIDLPSFRESLEKLHFPPDNLSPEKLKEENTPYHRRIKFSIFFPFQLALVYRREKNKKERGIAFKFSGELKKKLLSSLPFELTGAQKRVIGEIERDLVSPFPMNRLLQGDVGSGKTLVALVTALDVVESGYQVALMAPTEILAEQHYLNIRSFLEKIDIGVALLTGSVTGRKRDAIVEAIRDGRANIVVGTHALFQEKVEFNKLGYVIIDEQHRFGVIQRAQLVSKGTNPDVLVMTATPIPRTLAMTTYGDLDVSILDEMPPGRRPVKTFVVEERRINFVFSEVKKALERKEQVYFVYPLIEKSEKLDLKNATEMFENLRKIFKGYNVGLLHGRMSPEEKEWIMRKFQRGEIDILVSTTVIEVGVDVPNATVMVIEHAERFGLAQLHQLRGRVGRSDKESVCFLIVGKNAGRQAYQRLRILEKTGDGFKIAEEDLKLRGPGEILGTRQSGEQEIPYSDIIRYNDLLALAREMAEEIISTDPELVVNDHQAVKMEMFKLWGERLELGKIA